MFNKFFYQEQIECFICCSVDGKTETEKQYEMMCNTKHINYPLLTLSKAYNCKCQNLHAHNKCLLFINKCPTCRKIVSKPNLYVETKYDYYLYFLLNWIKKDTKRIKKIKWGGITYIAVMCLLLFIIDNMVKELFEKIIPPKSNISLLFAIVIGTLYFLSLYTFLLDDYFKKYWLYDSKTNKCYVL